MNPFHWLRGFLSGLRITRNRPRNATGTHDSLPGWLLPLPGDSDAGNTPVMGYPLDDNSPGKCPDKVERPDTLLGYPVKYFDHDGNEITKEECLSGDIEWDNGVIPNEVFDGWKAKLNSEPLDIHDPVWKAFDTFEDDLPALPGCWGYSTMGSNGFEYTLHADEHAFVYRDTEYNEERFFDWMEFTSLLIQKIAEEKE